MHLSVILRMICVVQDPLPSPQLSAQEHPSQMDDTDESDAPGNSALRSEPELALSPHSSPPAEESRVYSHLQTPPYIGHTSVSPSTSEADDEPHRKSSFVCDSPPLQCMFFTTYSHGIRNIQADQLKVLKEGQTLYRHHHGSSPSSIRTLPTLFADERIQAFFLPM
jgi:hypothetical protein